jgi:hypothetical protein
MRVFRAFERRETTDRFYRFFGRQKQNKFCPLDTELLEIVFSDHREWYAASGDTNFSSPNPVESIRQGMIGNRIFGGPQFRFYADLQSIKDAPRVQLMPWRAALLETGPKSCSQQKVTMPNHQALHH